MFGEGINIETMLNKSRKIIATNVNNTQHCPESEKQDQLVKVTGMFFFFL